MKFKHILILLLVIALMAILFYTMQSGETPEAYIEQIKKEREEKDHFMRTNAESPFAENFKDFKGLKYFPVDAHYRIMASLTPIENKSVVELSTNDGVEQYYLPYAYAEFELDGAQNKLLILEVMEEGTQRGSLFLAFGDATSALETYGAGRYLDIKKVPGGSTIMLDFNLAYNPYCAYSHNFSCPLPPRENLLSIPIRAGEKAY
jgi:uncharacterized protein